MEMTNDQKIIKLMENPVFTMHDGTGKLVRAQLFFVSFATLFLLRSGVSLNGEASVLGVEISGLELSTVLITLISLIAYQIAHFVWCSWDSFQEWRIRQSALGTGGWGGSGLEVTYNDPELKTRNNTLYAYLTFVLDTDLRGLKGRFSSEGERFDQKELDEISKTLTKVIETLEGERVTGDSLLRFDRWFRRFHNSQNWRWLLVETLLPILLGLLACILAAINLCHVG